MNLAGATIMDAVTSPAIWASWFRSRATWSAWFVFLRVLFGLPLDEIGLALYRECTGLDEPPPGGVTESWLVVGRRGGKSLILALVAVFLACFRDWSPYLSPGERGTIMVIATDKKQARAIYRYALALIREVPTLAALIDRDTAEQIDLTNGVTIEILTANFRSVRGYSLIAALCDEIAFWPSDEGSANPDEEILAAIRPAMATVPGAMLLCASSPYARRGALWRAHRQHFGKPGPVLVWRADTRTMNPTVPQSVIDEAMERDPTSAASEYDAQFRDDIAAFVPREVVEAAVVAGRFELPFVAGNRYVARVDPSGGRSDGYTVAIAHREKDGRIVLDLARERRPPFSPEGVTQEFAGCLKAYKLTRVTGDRYAGEWPREQFRKHGVEYIVGDKSASELYIECLPLFNSGKVDLLDIPRLIAQFCGLERRTARAGRDSIDHAPGGHDDIANAVAGAVVLASAASARWVISDETLSRAGPPSPWMARGAGTRRYQQTL